MPSSHVSLGLPLYLLCCCVACYSLLGILGIFHLPSLLFYSKHILSTLFSVFPGYFFFFCQPQFLGTPECTEYTFPGLSKSPLRSFSMLSHLPFFIRVSFIFLLILNRLCYKVYNLKLIFCRTRNDMQLNQM